MWLFILSALVVFVCFFFYRKWQKHQNYIYSICVFLFSHWTLVLASPPPVSSKWPYHYLHSYHFFFIHSAVKSWLVEWMTALRAKPPMCCSVCRLLWPQPLQTMYCSPLVRGNWFCWTALKELLSHWQDLGGIYHVGLVTSCDIYKHLWS